MRSPPPGWSSPCPASVGDWTGTGRIFVTEGRDGSGIIDVRDASTGERVHAFRAHHGDVTDVAFSADGTKLATTGDDGYLNIWDTTSWAELASFTEPRRDLQPDLTNAFAPAFSPDGSLVGAVWGDGIVQIMDLATSKPVWSRRLAATPFELQPNYASSRFDLPQDLAFSPDGQRFAVTWIFANGAVFDLHSGKQVFGLAGTGEVANRIDRAIAWSPDGRYLATTSADGTPRIWDAAQRPAALRASRPRRLRDQSRVERTPDRAELRRPGHGRDGRRRAGLAYPAGPGRRRSRASRARRRPAASAGVSFSPDGTRVMAGGAEVKVWDLRDRAGGEWADPPSPGPAAFLPNGNVVAPAEDGGP